MDNEEAASVLAQELTRYRRETYANLQRLLKDVDAYEVVGPSGAKYQVEIQAVWDDKPDGNLRVMGFVTFVAALALVTFSPIRRVRQPGRSLL